jgi:hypothetical protein
MRDKMYRPEVDGPKNPATPGFMNKPVRPGFVKPNFSTGRPPAVKPPKPGARPAAISSGRPPALNKPLSAGARPPVMNKPVPIGGKPTRPSAGPAGSEFDAKQQALKDMQDKRLMKRKKSGN